MFVSQFLGLTERSRLWVHSLHITITGQATSSGQSVASLMSSVMGTGVDWEKVRELTSDIHQEIPEKAHQLWDSVEAFQKVLLGQFPQKYINRVVACQIFFII